MRMIKGICCALFVLLLVAGESFADTNPPELTGFSFTPQVVGTGVGSSSITLQATVTDVDGVSGGEIRFRSPSREKSIYLSIYSGSRVSGSETDGVYEKTESMIGREEGVWSVDIVRLQDVLFNMNDSANEVSLSGSGAVDYFIDRGLPYQFTVDNGGVVDEQAPELTGFEMTPKVLSSTGSRSITFRATITDDLSGLDHLEIRFESPSGEDSFVCRMYPRHRVSGSGTDGVYEQTKMFSEDLEEGIWQAYIVRIRDNVDNYVGRISAGAVKYFIDRGLPYQFTVFKRVPGLPDFDGDGAVDPAVYHPSAGVWYLLQGTRGKEALQWGFSGTIPVAGDYDGDGLTDLTVYHPPTGTWYIHQSSTEVTREQQFGWSESVPVPADYDGDGIDDIAVYHPAAGMWYIWQSVTQTMKTKQFGWSESVPVPGDYDGDGMDDIAVYYPGAGMWYIWQSSTETMVTVQWGFAGTVPVPADYDGDGQTDMAVYNPADSMWYLMQSSQGRRDKQWGFPGVLPVPADYDGDGKADITVYHPNSGNWYVWGSADESMDVKQWGWIEAKPVLPQYQINKWFNLLP